MALLFSFLEFFDSYLNLYVQVEQMHAEIDKQWEEATPEVRELYGKEYFYRSMDVGPHEHAGSSPDPVLDAIEDALINVSPQPRYIVPGSDLLIDRFAVGFNHFIYIRTNKVYMTNTSLFIILLIRSI